MAPSAALAWRRQAWGPAVAAVLVVLVLVVLVVMVMRRWDGSYLGTQIRIQFSVRKVEKSLWWFFLESSKQIHTIEREKKKNQQVALESPA